MNGVRREGFAIVCKARVSLFSMAFLMRSLMSRLREGMCLAMTWGGKGLRTQGLFQA